MFVSAWHLYSQELLIFYLLHPFCSSKPDYNWVVGCCSHPGSSIHKNAAHTARTKFPVSKPCWDTLGKQSSCLSCLSSQISACAWQGTALVYILTGIFQWFFIYISSSFSRFLSFSYPSEHPRPLSHSTHVVSLDKGNSSHTVFGWFKIILCSLSGLAHKTVLTCVFVWFLFVPLKIKSSCSSMHNAGLKAPVLLRMWLHCSVHTVVLSSLHNPFQIVQSSRSSPISTDVEAVPKRSIFA